MSASALVVNAPPSWVVINEKPSKLNVVALYFGNTWIVLSKLNPFDTIKLGWKVFYGQFYSTWKNWGIIIYGL